MDLRLAVQRYEERRRFWAREIALLLQLPSNRSQRAVLRQLAAMDKPMNAKSVMSSLRSRGGTQKTHQSYASNVLKKLMGEGLVKRRRSRRNLWYELTELGGLVLMYLPMEHEEVKEVVKEEPSIQTVPPCDERVIEEEAHEHSLIHAALA